MDATRLVVLQRRIIAGFAIMAALGALVELAMLRHFKSGSQLVPWFVLALVILAAVAHWARPGAATAWIGRAIGIVALLGGAYGVYEHIQSNLNTAALSIKWADTWESLPWIQQVYEAATGGAGAAPPLAPGFLGLAGLMLIAATLGTGGRADGSEKPSRPLRGDAISEDAQ